MNHDHYDEQHIRDILTSVKTIALLGASANPARPSYSVMRFLLAHDYMVYPVNPGHEGQMIHGQKVYAKLADIPEPIDMVDVFRASEYLDGVIDEALALQPLPKLIWTQLGVFDEKPAQKAEAAGIKVIMNRCPAIEYTRLMIA